MNTNKNHELNLSEIDKTEIKAHGIEVATLQQQFQYIQNGIPKAKLHSAATINNGITLLSTNEFMAKAHFFDKNKSTLKLMKFVPASGAASRMFKFLTVFLNDFDILNETINAYINRTRDNDLALFIVGIEKFPFYKSIVASLREQFVDYDHFSKDYKNYCFIKFMLESSNFDFANKPKGILPFHTYLSTVATPIEEHLYECGYYANVNGKSHLNFTISEAHLTQFESIIEKVSPLVEKETHTEVSVGYSFQNKSTDSISVDENGNLYRNAIGKLVFRPGGHGALIENLNNLDADFVFIKNIDNVILHNNYEIALYKKALAGILLEYQHKIHRILNQIDSGTFSENDIKDSAQFLNKKLNINTNFSELDCQTASQKIKELLNKPIRVCGMVKNEGEPGGGPFWVENPKSKEISLQIVESAQVDTHDEHQVNILRKATHFNPVDLVCSIKDYQANKFNLTNFVDQSTGFVVEKNILGKRIKSYELPGLWNGAMGNWISIFVEVPLVTFNPVKTVNDLLKPAHQNN